MLVNMFVQPVVICKDFYYQYETLSVLKRQKAIKIKLYIECELPQFVPYIRY